MSDSHYVAVLRFKRGERIALANLDSDVRERLTPLIEFPNRLLRPSKSSPTPMMVLRQLAVDLSQSWQDERPVFCDVNMLRLIHGVSGHPLDVLGAESLTRGGRLIPVLHFGHHESIELCQAIRGVLASHRRGMAFRVSPMALRLSSSEEVLHGMLARYQVEPSEVDLIIDQRLVHDGSLLFAEFMNRIPWMQSWRSLILLSGSFPKDLSEFAPGEHSIKRVEWHLWMKSWRSRQIERCPSFSDYTTQHPFYREPPLMANFSASIRYAADGKWVLMRGEGVRNKGSAGFDQWPANAQLLYERQEFCGADFSEGDRWIAERAADPSMTGTAESWLANSINHHMTFVANSLSSLPSRQAFWASQSQAEQK